MSKNLTRKGLAFGALVALSSTLFAGAPAFAADELALTPNTGSLYAVPSGNIFVLKASYPAGKSPANAAKLKFKVTTSGVYAVNALASDDLTAVDTKAEVDANSANQVAAATTSGVFADATAGTNPLFLGISPAAADDDSEYSANVQAFEDADNDGVLDTDEWSSPVRTVTWVKHADLKFDVTIVEPTTATTSAAVRVTSSSINISQLITSTSTVTTAGQMAVVFKKGSTLVYSAGSAASLVATYDVSEGDKAAKALVYNSTDDRLEASSATISLAAGDSVTADVYFLTNDTNTNLPVTKVQGALTSVTGNTMYDYEIGGADGLLTGTANAAAIKSATATVITPSISALGQVSVKKTATAVQDGTATSKVISGTSEFSVKSTITAVAGQSKSGVPVVFTIRETSGGNSLAAAAVITSGASKLQNTNGGTVQTVDVTGYTDADGVATVTFSVTGTKTTNAVEVVANAQGQTGALTTVTFQDRAIGAINNVSFIGASGEQVVAIDKAFPVKVGVTDQFGNAITEPGYTVSVTDGTSTVLGNVVSGVATLEFPKYTTLGNRSLTVTAAKYGTDSGLTATFPIKVGTQTATASITYSIAVTSGAGAGWGVGADADLAVNTKDFANADTRAGQVATDLTGEAYTTITAYTYDATNAAVSADVTFAAKGLGFEAGGVYSRDSITIRSTTAGAAVVKVYSQTGGTKSLTITSGTVVKTQSIVHAASAATAGATLTLSGSSVVKAGRSLTITGLLADKYGNGVSAGAANNFKVTYVGPGFAVNVPTASDADGTFAFNVLYLNNETGAGTVTVKYDQNADGDYGDSTDLTATKVVLVGVSASITKAATSSAVVKNAKGATVKIVRGTKSKTVTATSNSQKISVKGGTGTVKVYVNGVKVASK